ncbi:AAA family ATPase [Acinetobacter lwoffii]|uniref:AAA family ATPase n=1 Tax=Acinetobacter lwoffii TaxID=28090 RepID=UPI003F8D89D4
MNETILNKDDKFSWIEVYKELFEVILSYENKQNDLVGIIQKITKSNEIDFGLDKIVKNNQEEFVEHSEIDPFTVLSAINSGGEKSNIRMLQELFNINGNNKIVVSGFNFGGVPRFYNAKWFYPFKQEFNNGKFLERNENDIPDIWKVFKKIIKNEDVKSSEFARILNIRSVGIIKLSQALYLSDPVKYIPLTPKIREYLKIIKIKAPQDDEDKSKTWSEYLDCLNALSSSFNNKPMYLIYEEIFNMEIVKGIEENDVLENLKSINRDHMCKHPLNQILYGPAGTGKTYNTINYALSILDGRDPEKQQTQDDRDKFKRYMDEGRISFVTFHQSYGYEDFVEGIKVVSENNQLTYPIIPGIFKNICQLASANVKSNISEKFDLGNRAIWKMSLGRAGIEDDLYRSCLDNDVVLLGWGDDIDFTGCNELQTIKQKLTEFDYPINQLDTASSYVNTFKNKIKNGDLIVITDGNLKFRAIAEVIGAYEYDSEQEFSYHQVRKVKWLKSFSPSLKNEDYFKKIFSQSTVYNLENAVDKDKLQNLLTKGKNEKSNIDNKYVLIIDEINRGNISKIFGELITLIEDSKRAGNKEELPLTLPYSNEPFSVPNNLYIIGTMNSSDRSLTSVDIALRRRFEFIEMMPKPDVLSGIDIEGVSVQYILETMNKRIKVLLDRDHCIGHAYFTPLIEEPSLELLMTIFEKRIIPLLQEYFFDDWTKINLVLGENGMVHTMNLDSSLFLSMNSSEIEHLTKRNWDVNKYLFKNAPLEIKINALNQIISPKKDYKIPKLENTVKEAS